MISADPNVREWMALALRSVARRTGQTFEVLVRTWHVTERSVRPDHRMVAHTGFITTARMGPGRAASVPGGSSG